VTWLCSETGDTCGHEGFYCPDCDNIPLTDKQMAQAVEQLNNNSEHVRLQVWMKIYGAYTWVDASTNEILTLLEIEDV